MPRRHKRMKAPSKANCKKTLKRVPKPNRKHTCEFVGRTIECGLPVSDGKCDPLSSNMSDSCCDSSHRLVQIGDGPHPQDCAVCDYSDCEFRYVTHVCSVHCLFLTLRRLFADCSIQSLIHYVGCALITATNVQMATNDSPNGTASSFLESARLITTDQS